MALQTLGRCPSVGRPTDDTNHSALSEHRVHAAARRLPEPPRCCLCERVPRSQAVFARDRSSHRDQRRCPPGSPRPGRSLVDHVMECRVAVGIDGIDVRTQVHCQPYRRLGAVLIVLLGLKGRRLGQRSITSIPHRVAPAGTGRQHQWCPTVLQRKTDVGAGRRERVHQIDLRELRRERKRGRAQQMFAQHEHLTVASHSGRQRDLCVRPSAVRQQGGDHLQTTGQHGGV